MKRSESAATNLVYRCFQKRGKDAARNLRSGLLANRVSLFWGKCLSVRMPEDRICAGKIPGYVPFGSNGFEFATDFVAVGLIDHY